MRYWAYFAAKLIVAAAILYGSLALLNPLVPHDVPAAAIKRHQPLPNSPVLPAPQDSAAVQPGTELQVEIAQPSGDEEHAQLLKSREPADEQEKKDKARALAPLYHGSEYLAINLGFMLWFLFGAGMLYLIVSDQRYRCRVCLRRLVMPVETGSRGFMLQLGRPRTEYICPYGHGTLRQEQFLTSGLENPEWTAASGDMWEDLYAASKQARDQE
jgi:hypothetical protein